MLPGEISRGGSHNGVVLMAWTTVAAPAPLRQLTLGVTAAGVAYLSFGGGGVQRLSAVARRTGVNLVVDAAWTDPAARQLSDYLIGQRRTFDLPVDWSRTAGVQRSVLTTLHGTVGYGDTITYGELAARSAAFGAEAKDSARAVGSIMGSNPIPVIVPCHRVLAADGLGGFGGGLEVKRWLLALEGALTPSLDFEKPTVEEVLRRAGGRAGGRIGLRQAADELRADRDSA